MKRVVTIIAVLFTVALWAGASEEFFGQLTEAQRYDLADAYQRVADRFDELGQRKRASRFRAQVDVIFPGFAGSERPEESLTSSLRPEPAAPDPAGSDASYYYFNKLLHGVFNENIPLILSAVGDVLYLPMFDEGVVKSTITGELTWFFDNYDLEGVAARDIFDMESIVATPSGERVLAP